MREALYRRFEASLTRTSAQVAAWGLAPAALAVVAFAVTLGALPPIAKGYYAVGFAIFLLGRSINVFAVTAGETGGRGDCVPAVSVLDCIGYAGVPFAFALADPTRALAASFLLFGFVAVSSASEKSVRNLDALICIAAFAIVCFVPAWFGSIAYGLGIACFAVSGIRLTRSSA